MTTLTDPLIGTAWVYYGPPQDGETVHLFYTEVVTVQDDHAVLVAPLGDERPSPTWRVPVTVLTHQFSAFHPLGPASDLGWLATGRWVMTIDLPPTDPLFGAWQIEWVGNGGVFMHTRNDRIVTVTWFDVRRKFRPATPDEANQGRLATYATLRRPTPAPVVEPEPIAPAPPAAPVTPAWTRLATDRLPARGV